jgi:uroporphyrinogen-III decarboxylase
MAKVRIPGVELPPDDMWQVVESDLMKVEDYDNILEQGWPNFFETFMRERILDDAPADMLPPRFKGVDVRGSWFEKGVPVLSGGDITTPIELLCGSRSLIEFAADLINLPDKVQAVMDLMGPHLAGKAIRRAKKLGYPAVWIGGWRAAPFLYSPKMWDRFVWPYFSRLVDEVVDAGLIALLHLDSDWTRELKRFRELPPGKCIMALDGETDIFEAKQILGDHICLMGDVPAAMLYLDEPDTVYNYAAGLIQKLGPTGFILQSGCDIPTNAKLENVQAMVAAALEA